MTQMWLESNQYGLQGNLSDHVGTYLYCLSRFPALAMQLMREMNLALTIS